MPNNTERLLEGYEVKPTKKGFGHGQPSPVEGESYTISDKPDRLVCSLFDSLERFEANHPITIGRLYMLISAILISFVIAIKQEFLTNLPSIEVIFVCFLITLIFNYYLMNGALFKPFVENQSNSHNLKLCGGYAVAAIACFFYGLNFIALSTAVTIFYSSFFLVILFEMAFLKESYKTNEILLAAGAFFGAFVTIMGSEGQLWATETLTEASTMSGFALSAISAIFMALIMMNFGKMEAENFTTMNHIFTLIIVLFTPMFFPIQGVVTPTMNQWGILIGSGLMTAFATLFFIRSLQLENGARAAVFLSLQIALVFIIEMLFSKASGIAGILGAAITIGCVFSYNKEFQGKTQAKTNATEQDANAQEMVQISRSG